MQENNTTHKKNLLYLFLVLLLCFLLFKTFSYFGAIGYRETWSICLNYMHEETFWSGQPHCEGAILPFYVLFALDSLVGREYVQIATIIFSTLITLLFSLLFLRVVQKELSQHDPFWPLLFFGLFFYVNTITNVEAIMNSFFFFVGYYFLFHTSSRWKYLFTGFFLSLSLLSKINVVVQIAFLLFWYAYETKMFFFADKKLHIVLKKEVLFGFVQVLLPIAALFLLFSSLYPYFWIYSWGVFTNQTISLSIFQTLREMFFFDLTQADIIYIPILAVAAVGIYLFCKEQKFYALMTGPVFLLCIFLITRAFGLQFVTGLRYWSVITPFVALSLLRLQQLWQQFPQKQILQSFLVMLLLYPGFYYGPFQMKDDLSYIDSLNIVDAFSPGWQQKDTLVKQIHYGYSVIPPQKGRILLENDHAGFTRMAISFGSNIPLDNVDYLTKKYMESYPDIWGFPRYQELLGEHLISSQESGLNAKEQEFIQKIDNGTYSLLIYGPPEWTITQKLFAHANQSVLSSYCSVAIPSNVWLTEEGWHLTYFFFQNPEDCSAVLQQMFSYYMQHYQEICTADQFTANMITIVLHDNDHLNFPYTCTQGGGGLSFAKKGTAVKRQELVLMLLLMLVPFAYELFFFRSLQSPSISFSCKIIFYISILLLLLALFFVLFFMSGVPVYSPGIVQTIG